MSADPDSRTLAIFDLDNTLLAGDSDYAWCDFLAEKGFLGRDGKKRNRDFFSDYNRGVLQMEDWLEFSLAPLARIAPEELRQYREQFLEQRIAPMFLPAAAHLLERHRRRGHAILIISATNSFIAAPIAELLGADAILATRVETRDGHYTGNFSGTPCFQQGKVLHLEEWLRKHDGHLEGSFGYGDSRNDIPLLERVGRAHAVDPDPVLHRHAEQQGWELLTLRDGDRPLPLPRAVENAVENAAESSAESAAKSTAESAAESTAETA